MTQKREAARDQRAAKDRQGHTGKKARLTKEQKQVMREVVQRRRKVYEELAKH